MDHKSDVLNHPKRKNRCLVINQVDLRPYNTWPRKHGKRKRPWNNQKNSPRQRPRRKWQDALPLLVTAVKIVTFY